ncbi:cAMP-regulated D2 protein [Holothuria leucospilota]|uniref:cAMP-regulated D2 protein n=1 Tax=Holothuria leucospilota TaxID=206669 RepID=A0A9Q0YFP8_HOLLE|nr:cAMP-regulated D2 protein [Holothuria leucospilota]
MGWLRFVFTVALCSNASVKSFDAGTSEPIFETEYGIMVGKKVGDNDVFLGVPFAKPPVGELRFKDPVKLEKSTEVQNTITDRPICMQSIGGAKGDEDCLYLNIYKPTITHEGDSLPVLVYFPGGNFMNGGCSSNGLYNATILAPDIKAIVVCANYRLGAFGFLYYNETIGNFGIKDQKAALEFISENIRNLGGDPNKITISGQSAGAQSVAIHLTSEQDNDLFQQAILMSGPFSVSLKSEEEALKLSEMFMEELKCKELDLPCLLHSSAIDILKASENCSPKHYNVSGNTLPLIQKALDDMHQFFNDKVTHLEQPWGPTVTVQPITKFKSVEKPVMIGSLSGEGSTFAPPPLCVDVLNLLLPEYGTKVIDEYRELYNENEIFVHFLTDYVFTCPARSMAKDMNSPHAYHYYFDHVLSFAEGLFPPQCKEYACHGELVPFFFQSASAVGETFTTDEETLVDIFSEYLSNFIHYGDPNKFSNNVKPELANLNLVPWKPINPRDLQTMVFSTTETVECKIGIRQKQCDLMDDIGYYNVPYMN